MNCASRNGSSCEGLVDHVHVNPGNRARGIVRIRERRNLEIIFSQTLVMFARLLSFRQNVVDYLGVTNKRRAHATRKLFLIEAISLVIIFTLRSPGVQAHEILKGLDRRLDRGFSGDFSSH